MAGSTRWASARSTTTSACGAVQPAVKYDVLSSSGWASVTPPDTLRAVLYRYDSFSGLILPLDNTQVEVTWLAFAAIGKYAEQTG